MKLNLTWIAAGLAVLTAFGCKPPPPPEQKVPVAASVKSFTVDKPQIAEPGESVTLSWEVGNATGVSLATLDGTAVALADPSAATGSTQSKVEKNTVFVLTAHGEGGSDSAAVSVVLPTQAAEPLLVAIPDLIEAGAKSTLVWNAAGAAQVSLTDGAGQTVYSGDQTAGSLSVTPNSTTNYTLTAGDATITAKVAVSPAVVAFSSSVDAAQAGEQVTLSWKVGGAESLTLSADGRGDLTTVTDPAQLADGSFVDTVPADLPKNGRVHYTLTANNGGEQAVREFTLFVGTEPAITSYKIPAFAKVGGSYQVQWHTVLADHLELRVDGTVVHVATSPAEVKSGTFNLPTAAQDVTVEIRATNSRGGLATQTTQVSPVDTPSLVSFAGTPLVAANGGDPVTLTWDVTNARHVKISVPNKYVVYEQTGTTLEQGSVDVYPNGPTDYVFEADNLVGDAIAPQTFTADVTNPAKLVFSPPAAVEGDPVQLTGTTVQGGGALTANGFALKNVGTDAFVDISSTGTPLPFVNGDDTVSYVFSLPTPFLTTWNGVPAGGSAISVSINGWMVFSPSAINGSASPSTSLPNTSYAPLALVPFGRDLEADGSSAVYWRDEGTGAQRRIIVQWDDIPYWLDSGKRVTCQVQLYGDGQVVFAYDDVSGWSTSDAAAVGILSADESSALEPLAGQFDKKPASGDTFHFFGELPLPYAMTAQPDPFPVRQQVGQGFIDIDDGPVILTAKNFWISEANYNPVAGQEEWFEVSNSTAAPADLNGWTIDFGGGSTFTLSSSLIVPAGGSLVFGQSANSAEGSAGGAAVDYVYGTGLSMPDAAGSLTLQHGTSSFQSLKWTSAGTAGVSLQTEQNPSLRLASGVSVLTCPSTASYGATGQLGTPGAANGHCFPYALSSIPGAFQSIATTGTLVGTLSGASGTDEVQISVALTRPVMIFGQSHSTLTVSSNGFISPLSLTSAYSSNNSTPSTSNPNLVIAPFWDDLIGNATGSVLWQQFDPDGVPGNADDYTLVSWEDWAKDSYPGSLNFQVKLMDTTGDIEFHYGSMSASTATYAQGLSATTWLENAAGNAALPVNVNSATNPGIQPNSGWRFTYTP